MQARGLLNYRLKCCWPKVILYVSQTNLNGKWKKLGGQIGAKQKSGGAMAYPAPPPLESPLFIGFQGHFVKQLWHHSICLWKSGKVVGTQIKLSIWNKKNKSLSSALPSYPEQVKRGVEKSGPGDTSQFSRPLLISLGQVKSGERPGFSTFSSMWPNW